MALFAAVDVTDVSKLSLPAVPLLLAVNELAGKDAKAIFTAYHQGSLQAKTIIENSAKYYS